MGGREDFSDAPITKESRDTLAPHWLNYYGPEE